MNTGTVLMNTGTVLMNTGTVLMVAHPNIAVPLENQIKLAIYRLHLEHPEIVYAQAVLESKFFTSKLFKRNHNMFGMKVASSRPTTAIGTNGEYAEYNNWRDSLLDYALFQAAYMRGFTFDEYMEKLSRSYAEDDEYTSKLIRIINNKKHHSGHN
jgi:uncharacterized FlgJ-related protein